MSIKQQLQQIAATQDVHTNKLNAIIAELGVSPDEPENFVALSPFSEGDNSMRFRPPQGRVQGARGHGRPGARVSLTGSNVIQPFSWDPASDGGITQGYHLQIQAPDGSLSDFDVPLGTSFEVTLPDDNQTYGAQLFALAADGTASVPAGTTFVPHTDAVLPATPGNFQAGPARPA